MGKDNILIVVILAVIAYLFLKKDETPVEDIAAQKRAESMCVGQTGLNRFLCETGVWLVGAPAAPTQSPQTPAPFTSPEAARRAVSKDCKVFDDGVWWQRHFNPDGTVVEARATIMDYFLPECK